MLTLTVVNHPTSLRHGDPPYPPPRLALRPAIMASVSVLIAVAFIAVFSTFRNLVLGLGDHSQAAAGFSKAHLRLAINGLPLPAKAPGVSGSAGPFIDHTHQWPPVLTWTIHGGINDVNLRQTGYSVALAGDVASKSTMAMQHTLETLPIFARSNQAYDVKLSVTLTEGAVLRISSCEQNTYE